MSISSDQDIVFYPDSSEIHPVCEFFISNMFFMFSFFFPFSEQLGDKINSGFDGDRMMLFESPAQSQIGSAEGFRSLRFAVIADKGFTQPFHIMDIQSEHVPQTVREK